MGKAGLSLSPKADLCIRRRSWVGLKGAIVMPIKTPDCFGTTCLATTKGEEPRNNEREGTSY